ncbi:hypothetical protein BKA66DRAFT_71347 [Pyrenochaeta sp. MPI-SDFR-AT-0127]|nr:hypothetical protein BKA66DRAFT_71347 [Pyrenochaeta sp. MPI-SDFR-AT-0127]
MPPKKGAVADAWEDDWETIADKEQDKPDSSQPEPKLTKSQLKAKHVELNRQIWESAENPEPQWYPEAHTSTPVQPTFKPKVTMLARKPTPQVLSRNMAGMNLEDDDDSEDERQKKAAAEFEERKARAQRERAEKERKYAEARERIFGSPAASATEDSRSNSPSKATRGKGRGRGGRDSQPRSSNEQSPARTAAPARQLFDPTYAPKPGSVYIAKREAGDSRPATPNGQEKPVRQPQGPARGGGRGFAPRGGLGSEAGPS